MKRSIRKSISILLIIVILTSFVPNLISIAAEPQFTLSQTGTGASQITTEVGQEFSIDYDLTDGMEGAMCLTTIVSYDPTMVEPIPDAIEDGEMTWYEDESLYREIANPLAALLIENISEGRNGISIVYGYTSGSRTVKANGKMATLKFKLLKAGSTSITVFDSRYTVGDTDDIHYSSSSAVTITANLPMTGLSLSQNEATINKGSIFTLTANKEPSGTSDTSAINWSSTDSSIATVVDGKVNALSVGETTITAECNGFSDSCKVTVVNPMTGISLNKTTLSLNKGQTATLTASKVPLDATDTTPITFSSSNESVATVDGNGLVTALANGETTITATCGSFTATCKVTVENLLTGLKLDKTLATIDKDQTIQLQVEKEPLDTTNTDSITWKSSNETVATVDENGLVTGVGNGKTTITASCAGFEATCDVTVLVHIESIKITNGDITLYKGQTEKLEVTFNPTDFSDSKTLIWTTDNENVVDLSNGTVTAKNAGTATITVETVNGKKDSITVTVPEVKAENLILNKNITTIEKGETETLKATILPETTTDDTTVVWSVNDENIITVDENGVVTAVAPGTAIVTAKCGELEDTCTVTVISTLQSIILNKNNIELEAGTVSEALIVTLNPSDATVDSTEIKWESLNPTIATVDENGIVTAVAPGTAIVRATLAGKSADCIVKVKVTLTGVEISGEDTIVVYENRTAKLQVEFTPSNATEIPEAVWESSDETIVTVDENGILTGVKEGTANITVKYGTLEASKEVRVEAIKATGITLIANNLQVTEDEYGLRGAEVLKNSETILEYVVMPENTTDKIEWRVSDENIIKVEQVASNPKQVKLIALGAGEASVVVSAGNFSDTLKIIVKEKPITSLKVKLENEVLEEEKTTKAIVLYEPEDTTDSKNFTFSSSNESVAVIDENGVITAKKAGTTYITATSINGVTSSQVKLLVIEKVEQPSSGGTSGGTSENISVAVTNTVNGLVSSPHTGDMNIIGLLFLMISSLAGIITLLKKK